MERQGLEDKDLVAFLGQRSRVAEVLNRQRGLSIAMIRRLHRSLNIPLACLVKEYELAKITVSSFNVSMSATYVEAADSLRSCQRLNKCGAGLPLFR